LEKQKDKFVREAENEKKISFQGQKRGLGVNLKKGPRV